MNKDEPERAVGFAKTLPSSRGLMWHWDTNCATLAGATQTTVTAGTIAELADEQATARRLPCWRCAYPVLLDDLSAHADCAGYHYIACTTAHVGGRDCIRCAALNAYARARNVLTAVAEGHVALLLLGALDVTIRHQFGGYLNGGSAHGSDLPAMSAASWASAAALLAGDVLLPQALEAAAALHAEPRSSAGRT